MNTAPLPVLAAFLACAMAGHDALADEAVIAERAAPHSAYRELEWISADGMELQVEAYADTPLAEIHAKAEKLASQVRARLCDEKRRPKCEPPGHYRVILSLILCGGRVDTINPPREWLSELVVCTWSGTEGRGVELQKPDLGIEPPAAPERN